MYNDYLDLLAVSEEGVEGQPVEPTNEPTTEVVDNPGDSVNNNEPSETFYEIDGEKYTPEQIREWKLGNMRQSDYTRKTQELSKFRKDAEEAMEVYNYLKSNPELVSKLLEADGISKKDADYVKEKTDPVLKEIQEIKNKYYMLEVEKELNTVLSKDNRVTDLELLEIASKNNCNIDTAYTIWKGINYDKLINDTLKKEKEKLANEITKNKGITKTLITDGDKNNDKGNYGLTDIEIEYANKLGMSFEEYARYKRN